MKDKTMPRPKFCVGQEVSTAFKLSPNLSRTEILSMNYVENKSYQGTVTGIFTKYTGYMYIIVGVKEGAATEESLLRKLPDDNNSLEDTLELILKTPLEA